LPSSSSSKHHYDEHDDWGNNWKRQSGQENYQQDAGGVFAHRLAYNAQQYPQQH
jgi:nuclear transport factor 2 (NTF2) superfamily protein